jgi:hypothetical protein
MISNNYVEVGPRRRPMKKLKNTSGWCSREKASDISYLIIPKSSGFLTKGRENLLLLGYHVLQLLCISWKKKYGFTDLVNLFCSN